MRGDLTIECVQAWRAVQPARWRPWGLGPAAVWLVFVVLAIALSGDAGCTGAHPCGYDAVGAMQFTTAIAAPVLLLWERRLGIVVTIVAVLVEVLTLGGRDSAPVWLVVGLAVGLVATVGAAAARERSTAQALAVLLDAVPKRTWDGAPAKARRTPVPMVSRGLLVLAALVLFGSTVYGHHVTSSREAAPHVPATVTAHDPDGYTITVALSEGQLGGADQRFDIDTYDSVGYPVGSVQEVVVQGDKVTLAVEGYDASWGLALAVGLVLLAAGLRLRSRRLAGELHTLLTEPQPTFRARFGALGDAQVLPLDGSTEVVPLCAVPVSTTLETEQQHLIAPVALGTLFGVPRRGAVAAVRLDDGTELLPMGRVRRPAQEWVLAAAEIGAEEAGSEQVLFVADDTRVPSHEIDALRARLTRPQRWRPPLGGLVLGGALVGGFLLVRLAEGPWTALWRAGLLASFAFQGLTGLVGSTELSGEALILGGLTSRRRIPWGAIRRVTVLNGAVVLTMRDEQVLPLTALPRRPFWARNSTTWATSWASVLAHEVEKATADPDAVVEKTPRSLAALLAVSYTLVVLLGLVLQR